MIRLHFVETNGLNCWISPPGIWLVALVNPVGPWSFFDLATMLFTVLFILSEWRPRDGAVSAS